MKLINKNFLDELHKLLKAYEISEVYVDDMRRIEFVFDDFTDRISIDRYENGLFREASTMEDYKPKETEYEKEM